MSDCAVEAVLPSIQTLLVPEEEFSATLADAYLAAAGMACRPDQCCVYTPSKEGAVAVMAIDNTAHEMLQGIFGERMHYATPLLAPCSIVRGVMLQRIETLLYVRVFDNGLQFAEVLPMQNRADLQCYLSMLDSTYHIYNMEVRISGNPAGVVEVCKPIFKHLTCE